MKSRHPMHPCGSWSRCASLVLCLLFTTLPVHAASRTAVLDDEPRLGARVDLSVKEEPLADLLARVAKENGAALVASPVAHSFVAPRPERKER